MKKEIKNLKKTANRILKAIKNNEKIILYGDADLDGVCSLIILEETINNLGGKVIAYLSDTENNGYGINQNALNELKKFSPALLISLDCGIGNIEEAKLAKKLDLELIIIDHHQALDKLPEASIIVAPKQKQDKYPFKDFSNTGIVYKLSLILLAKKMSDSLKNNFFELVALANIADRMPEIKENEIFIEKGLESLENSWRPGLKYFFTLQENKINSTRMIVHKIVSALNISQKSGYINETYLLLTASDPKEVKLLARNLIEKSYQRQAKIKETVEEIKKELFKKIEEPIIFEEVDESSLISSGSAASRICDEYRKPTFIFKRKNGGSRGSVRVPKEVDAVKIMAKCSFLLETFGGHALAAGFAIKNENLEKFKKCLIESLNI